MTEKNKTISWQGSGGCREVLLLAFPLILTTASWSIQQFVDRMFLAWYAPETIAAAMPAGMRHFAFISLFLGTASYVDTFVAQYYGAGRVERIGPAVWQGMYVALIGALFMLLLAPFAETIFALVGHAEAIRRHEVDYFRILCLGSGFPIAGAALSAFYAGRGHPWPVMWVNVAVTVVNLVLDYLLVFGRWGLPEMGIRGAAIATVIAGLFNVIAYLVMICRPRYNQVFGTISGWRLDAELFLRVLRYGIPAGMQFFFDMLAFTLFVLFVGRLVMVSLAATSIAYNINNLAFMPMLGMGIAISVLVGQHLGRDNPAVAEKSAWSGFIMAFGYMCTIACLYAFAPDIFIAPFVARDQAGSYAEIYGVTLVLLRFVAVYSLFDAMNIMFASAIKGAGDTRFVMAAMLVISLFAMVIPVYVVVASGGSVYLCWVFATLNIFLQGVVFWRRFHGGRWKSMRVIERH